MELVMAAIVGLLFAGGTYMMLRPNFLRIVMGLALLSNAANLLLITSSGFARDKVAPFVRTDGESADVLMATRVDPLPSVIILTAIVISFSVAALLLTVCYRVYMDHGTDNPDLIPLTDEDCDDDGSGMPVSPGPGGAAEQLTPSGAAH